MCATLSLIKKVKSQFPPWFRWLLAVRENILKHIKLRLNLVWIKSIPGLCQYLTRSKAQAEKDLKVD